MPDSGKRLVTDVNSSVSRRKNFLKQMEEATATVSNRLRKEFGRSFGA